MPVYELNSIIVMDRSTHRHVVKVIQSCDEVRPWVCCHHCLQTEYTVRP